MEREKEHGLIIGIAGGTGSGKSTFTNRLEKAFPEDLTVIYYDNYYRCQDEIPFERRILNNYDHPDALETELLIENLAQLREGKTVEGPQYNFSEHNRMKETITIVPKKVMIVEGILTLENPSLRELFDIKIFVDCDADERILRRAKRDIQERGRNFDNVMEQYLTTVKPMHSIYVEPTKVYADIIINSGCNDVAFDLVRTKIESLLRQNVCD